MATDKFIFDAKQKLSKKESIKKAIDFGIERETPKLKDDEILSVHINKVKGADNLTYLKIDVLRVKKESK